MTLTLRYYQQECVDSILNYWQGGGGNPLAVMATGTGKSPTQAVLARHLMTEYPDFRILCLVHVKELVEQNAKALLRAWPGAPIGINSAGVGRRDTWHPLLYASIQSVWRKPELLGDRDVVMIDECHLVPKKSVGMYRSLLDALMTARPDMRLVGFTATPFRLDSGRLDRGPDKLFDDTVYNYGIAQGIDDGYLCPLVSLGMTNEMATSGLQRRGGDFTDASVAAAADNEAVIEAAARELVQHGENRRSWLSFCAGVEHARKMADATRRLGITSATITGETTNAERARIIDDYKSGRIRHLTNAMVLTTGFDAPHTDLVSLFRPTLSTVLYIQSLGRGTRLVGGTITESIANGKENCLVLDFAGNVRRHGPVDAVNVQGSERGIQAPNDDEPPRVAADDVRARECPQCHTLNCLTALRCVGCDKVLIEDKPKHEAEAEAGLAILSRDKDPWEPVGRVSFMRHEKIGGTPTMRVEYQPAGRMSAKAWREWICFEHQGFAREKAVAWWSRLGGLQPVPTSIDEALRRQGEIRVVTHVKLKDKDGGYKEIIGRKLDPVARMGGNDNVPSANDNAPLAYVSAPRLSLAGDNRREPVAPPPGFGAWR